jgi:hypothetical protein
MTHGIRIKDLPSDDLISIVFAVRRNGSKLAGKARDLQARVIVAGFAKLVAPRLRSIDDTQRGAQIHRSTTLTETREPGSLPCSSFRGKWRKNGSRQMSRSQ